MPWIIAGTSKQMIGIFQMQHSQKRDVVMKISRSESVIINDKDLETQYKEWMNIDMFAWLTLILERQEQVNINNKFYAES